MKIVSFLIFVSLFATFLSCNPFKSDHPQASLPNQGDTDLNAKSILAYTDQIDKQLTSLNKKTSLIYATGELSFYVERFMNANQTVLLVEHTLSGGNNQRLKKYYFKNDSLVLEKDHVEFANENGKSYKDSRAFFRNHTIFKTENRTAANSESIKALPYIDVPLSQNPTADQTYLSNIAALHDAVEGNDKFEMVFENITTYPDSRYIVLKGKIQKNYMSSILVQERDELIDSLLNMPIIFKDRKLDLNWTIRDHEAIYVPSTKL